MARVGTIWTVLPLLVAASLVANARLSSGQPALGPPVYTMPQPPVVWSPPVLQGKALPINLPTALRLVNARTMDVAIAAQRIMQSNAQLEQARYAWLPTITLGADYL